VVSVGWSFVAAALSGGFWHERVCMRRSAGNGIAKQWFRVFCRDLVKSDARIFQAVVRSEHLLWFRVGIDRMQWNALSITAMMGWPAAVSAFFMVANTPVRYAMSRASNAGFNLQKIIQQNFFRFLSITRFPTVDGSEILHQLIW